MIPRASDDPRRMTSVLPTLLTLLNLCLGWLAIARVFEGKPSDAALFIILAAILDKLDGLVARATDSSSDFGRELDSLADIVSFGVAPAMVAISWGLSPLHRVGTAAAFLLTACGALRLARFNVLGPATDKRWFIGLPIPIAAGLPMSLVLSHGLLLDWNARLDDTRLSWAFAALLVACSGLMVSRIRYHAFKDLRVGKQWRMWVALGAVIVLAALVALPAFVLPGMAIAYTLHGPILRLLRVTGGRVAPRGEAEAP